jgi:predicted DNA-binding WGR domain protein
MRCWIHPEKYRYYQAELVPGLFGDWSLVCAWGGLGTPRGGYKITGVADYKDGLRKIEVLDVHRQRRGYVPYASAWRLAGRGKVAPWLAEDPTPIR